MRSNHITLADAISGLHQRAPHVIGSRPLWSLSSRWRSFEVVVDLPNDYADLDGVVTRDQFCWIECSDPDPVEAIVKAIDLIDQLREKLAQLRVPA
ncbi:hypothetical protein [Nocardia sp. NPDC051570]|uniref:hypothetical protein n=1 Tax=Nocardia sp. NPDC051570 TaxID=3364324 RepID=UPI003793E2FD